MASFCAKCGSVLPPDDQFCKSCGAPAATGGAVAAPAQPAAAPASSGSSALKIILIIVAVIIGLCILIAGAIGFIGYRIARNIHVDGPGGQVTMSTPGGTITANRAETFTASELGTDLYPGAQSIRGGMRMELPTGSMVTGVFLTSDSKQQVLDFYKGKFGSDASVFEVSGQAVISLNNGQQESVVVTISTNKSQDEGKTRIAIVHTKNTKAP